MAGSVGQEVEEEKIARWKRLGELEISEAFRQSGASEASISRIQGLINAQSRIDSDRLDKIARCLDLPDGRCLALALLGRGVSSSIDEFDFSVSRTDLTEEEAKALCVNLASNPNVRVVELWKQTEFGTPRGCTLIANALTTNDALKALNLEYTKMGPEAVKNLMEGVRRNKSLEILSLAGNPLSDEGIGYVAQMLSSHTTLEDVDLRFIECGDEGAKHMSAALQSNTTLKKFRVGTEEGNTGMAMLLKPLIHDQDGRATAPAGPKNTTITDLDLFRLDENGVESVASMIRTNKTLSNLILHAANLDPPEWVEQIIPALKENQTLESLDLTSCRGLTVEGVFNALLDLVQFSNTGLQKINLDSTHLRNKAGIVSEELRLNKEYRGRLRYQTHVKPKSGRLVLCGYEYAGKTSICETIRQIEYGTPLSHYRKMALKRFLKTHPGLRNFLFGKDAYKELQDRTRGFDIVILQKEPHTISIWDFAGQREYYALHDYLFPNVKNSCFLYICSVRCPPDGQNPGKGQIKDEVTMREEFLFWMRFIASNSKSSTIQDVPGGRQLPSVTFVLSNKDTLSKKQCYKSSQWAENIVSDLKGEFEEVIALSEVVEVVNTHSSKDVEHLMTKVNIRLAEILDQPIEYAICEGVRRALESFVTENPFTPLLSMEEFRTICETKVRHEVLSDYRAAAELNTPLGRETVLNYLNDSGEVIFSKGLELIIIKPRWFGLGVLGRLVNAFGGAQQRQPSVGQWKGVCGYLKTSTQEPWESPVHVQGFVTRNRVDEILEKSLQTMSLQKNISSQKLIDLMINLEMCFQEDPGNDESRLFVPALFDDETDDKATKGLRQLEWKIEHRNVRDVHYMGRRLECENKFLTLLTPGFFPRLQVVFRNFLHEQKWDRNSGFRVLRNFISFANNGMEVLMEYSGDLDYFVDILVKSSRSCKETLDFISIHVVKKVRAFCASPQGCQGVELVEAVIRPICVEKLHFCANRKANAVLVSELELRMNGESANRMQKDSHYIHTWSEEIEGVNVEDYALDLLEGEGSYEKFKAASQADQPESSSSAGTKSASYISQGISSIHQGPKCFYPTIEDIGIIRTLQKKITKVMPVKIHLMCDNINRRDGPHIVQGQRGRTLALHPDSEGGENNWLDPTLKFALSIFYVGVGSAVNVATGGVPVDISPILPVDDWMKKLNTTKMPFAIDTLVRMMDSGRNPAPVSEQEVLKLLKKYLDSNSTEWLTGFINLQESKKFRDDFQLQKVIYIDTSEVGWLCKEHYKDGLERRIVKLP